MNVLFISNDPALFVEGSAVRERMRAYARAFWELHILSRAARNQEVHEGTLHLYGIRSFKLLAPLKLAKRARAIILSKDIEIVSAQDPFEHGWAALRAVRGTSAKLHLQLHTDLLSPWFVSSLGVSTFSMRMLNRLRIRIADRVFPKADGIRVVSERLKESLLKRYGTRIPAPQVVPIAVATEALPPLPLPEHQFAFALLAASRLEPEKRIGDILRAIARIKGQYPGVGLFVAGSGRARASLERLARSLEIADRVIFLGEQGKDARRLMGSAQAFIQASAYEGYGITLIEAALARVPIITTDVGIVGEVFRGYQEVLSVPPGDPAALALQIVGLLEDQQVRSSLVINAEAAAKAHLVSSEETTRLIKEGLEASVRQG